VICNYVCAAHWVVFPVELVEPVKLRGIRRGHVGPARGTGGTGAGQAREAGVKISLHGSTGPTRWFHQNQQNCLQCHRFHLAAPNRDGSLQRLKMSLPRPMGIL
jgi:hypothetical protein